jgi:acetyltransferase-like isoleucine patch superfamily enzyme
MDEERDLSERSRELLEQLRQLRSELREATWRRYRRTNPFVEDLFEWKEKGCFVGGIDVTVYDSTTIAGEVTIGDHTWVGPFCSLDGTGRLTIGRSCSISAGTHIQTHDTVRWALSGGRHPYEYAPVIIGHCCFVGVNAVITRGVTIGDHCVVAAGAVVTRDVPPFSIVAGVPARPIGTVSLDPDGLVDLRFAS